MAGAACKEADEKPVPQLSKWAIVTIHPSLPSRDEQVARARAWGIPECLLGKQDVSALIFDDVRKQKPTTKWIGKLPKREVFLNRLAASNLEGGTVFFATPLCVGFGKAHALETIQAVWAAGFHVYVHSSGAQYAEGDDLAEFFGQLAHDANVAYVRNHRRKQK